MESAWVRAWGFAACVAAGLLGGHWLAAGTPQAWTVAISLALATACTALLLDQSLRTRRLLGWLGQPRAASAPRGPGALGELGYRIERALRARDDRTAEEQRRLAQFLSAIEAAPNGVVLLDAHDQIRWFNQRAAEHFGLDAPRDIEQRVTNLIREPAFVAHLDAGRADEAVVFTRGQAELSVTVRPYGEAMKLVMSEDITERERSDRMRRDFVANVSHEIRSPLTVLSGFVETLAHLPLTDPEKQRVLQLMRQQTERMQSLVTDLLSLAQIEGAPMPHDDHWVDVGALLQRVQADALALDAERHQIALHAGPEAQVRGIESELFSAVWNLVGNALRYTPAGGAVKIAWALPPEGGGSFTVSDTGVGIARQHLPRLTERFYRVDASRSRETGGTGLGLAIVKHVVQRHGGQLLIDSVPGQGSTFQIVLPAHRVRPAAAAGQAPALGEPREPVRAGY